MINAICPKCKSNKFKISYDEKNTIFMICVGCSHDDFLVSFSQPNINIPMEDVK